MSDSALHRFVSVYQSLGKDNLQSLREIYSDSVVFKDNLHELQGIDALLNYFESQYRNLNHCQFDVQEAHQQNESAWVIWHMDYSHRQIKGGQTIHVHGASHLRCSNKVYFHRDYMDMGEALYEHLPLVGRMTRWIKRNAAQ